MVDLPSIANRIPQVRAPESRVSPAQVADPYNSLAATLDKAGQTLMKDVAEPAALRAGLQSVTRTETGEVKVERAPIFGEAAHSYARGMRFAALTEAEGEVRRRDIAMREQFRNDPGAYDAQGRPTGGYLKAADEFRREQVKQWTQTAGAEVGLQVGRVIERETTTTYRGLLAEKERLDLQRATRSIEGEIEITKNEMYALAASGGTGTADFQERQAKVRRLYGELVDNPRLAYPRERADAEIKHLDSELRAHATVHSITQVMERDGAEAAMRAAEKIRTDPSLNLTREQRDAYYSRAVAAINKTVTQATGIAKNIQTEIQSIDKLAADGITPEPARIANLRQAVAESKNPELQRQFDAMQATLPIVQAWRQMSPAQLEQELSALERQNREHGNERTQALLATGQKLLTRMRTEIQRDPLGWANRAGVVTVPPIEWGSERATDDMRHRAAIAETVAQRFGTPVQYLTPDERRGLDVAVSSGTVPMQQVAQLINAGFGPRAPAVFREVSQQAPVLAHMGGLLSGGLFGGGSQTFANDVAEGVALMRRSQMTPQQRAAAGLPPGEASDLPQWARGTAPSANVARFENERRVDQFGNAFIMVPDTGRAAAQSAKAAFVVRALRQNHDPSITSPTPETAKAYNDALQEGAGATFVQDGRKRVQYGGVTGYGTRPGTWFAANKVLVPGNVRADRFGDVIGAIRDDDLKLLPVSPMAADGRVYSARDLQGAVPVAVPGGYRFAVGDPVSDDPKWIRGADGRPFVLDFDAMSEKLRQRVPGAFTGTR